MGVFSDYPAFILEVRLGDRGREEVGESGHDRETEGRLVLTAVVLLPLLRRVLELEREAGGLDHELVLGHEAEGLVLERTDLDQDALRELDHLELIRVGLDGAEDLGDGTRLLAVLHGYAKS